MNEVRVLPPDVWDALELSALAFGGIGGGKAWENGLFVKPYCVVGHAAFVGLDEVATDALRRVFDGRPTDYNDRAVPVGKRISFASWCKRLNVIRGSTGEPTRTPDTEP